MTESAAKLRLELETLDPVQQAELAHFLIRSLENSRERLEIEPGLEQELESRAAEIRSGRERGEPAEEVFARLRTKYAPQNAK